MLFLNKLILIAITLLTLNAHITNSMDNNLQLLKTRNHIILGVLGAGALCLTGKKMHDYYYDYLWPHKDMIKYCHNIYQNIDSLSTRLNINAYKDLLNSNNDLKQTISSTCSTQKYQFVAYHTQLTQCISTLQKYIYSIETELIRIEKRKAQLKSNSQSTENENLLTTFIQLETNGKRIIADVHKIITQLLDLKKHIELLEEYKNDYAQWLIESSEKEERSSGVKESTDKELPADKERLTDPDAFSSETIKTIETKEKNPNKQLIKLMHAAWDN